MEKKIFKIIKTKILFIFHKNFDKILRKVNKKFENVSAVNMFVPTFITKQPLNLRNLGLI